MSLRLARRLSSGTFGAVLVACLTTVLALPAAAQTMVRVQTPKGPIDMVLKDSETPLTVANFLGYVQRQQYDGSIFHRLPLPKNFVLQGGGFNWSDGANPRLSAVTTTGMVQNEYSPTRPNVRGTVAMAKLGGNPNSATSQWFVNLKDNTAILDPQNGGFTVFATVTPTSMAVVDQLAEFEVVNAAGCGTAFGGSANSTSALGELPLSTAIRDKLSTQTLTCSDINSGILAYISSVRQLPAKATLSDSDRVFNYLEAAYPQYAAPASAASQTESGYFYRYYPATKAYVGTKDGQVWYLIPGLGGDITLLGSLADWLGVAAAAGY